MRSVTIRELRNHGGDVVERVQGGEPVLVTRDGKAVAELRPLPSRTVNAEELWRRRRTLPPVDPASLRRDVDEVIDSQL